MTRCARDASRIRANMNAIYRVDGNNVVTSPDAAGPWDRACSTVRRRPRW